MSKSAKYRRYDLKLVGHFYRKKFRWLRRCVYCGDYANSQDHVLPVSAASKMSDAVSLGIQRKEFGQGLNLVPCCRECNTLAGDTFFTSIKEKRRFIQDKLRRRIPSMAEWSDGELVGMSDRMSNYIKAHKYRIKALKARIDWPNGRRKSSEKRRIY